MAKKPQDQTIIEGSVTGDVPASESSAPVAGAVLVQQTLPGTEVVPYDPVQMEGLKGIAEIIGAVAGPVVDNFPRDPMERWRLDNAATTGQSVALVDIINQTIEPKYWRIEAVSVTNYDNGEVDNVPRVVLFDQNGTVYHAVSFGVFQVVASFARVFKRDPLPKGFKLRVAQLKTRAGFRMLTLQAVTE